MLTKCVPACSVIMALLVLVENVPQRVQAAPFVGVVPKSGPPCSEVLMVGGVPPPPYGSVRATINGKEIARIAAGIYKPSLLPSTWQQALVGIVPGDATSGAVAAFVTKPGFLNAPGKSFKLKFGKFAVTGTTVPQPLIKGFDASPQVIDADAGGSDLRLSVAGKVDVWTVSGVPNNPLQPPHLHGPVVVPPSIHVNPTATTTYTLAVGNKCLSEVTRTTVTVLPRLSLTLTPNPADHTPGQDVTVTATIPTKLNDVVVTCSPAICAPLKIFAGHVSGTLVVHQPGVSSKPVLVTARLDNSSQTASATLNFTTRFKSGNFILLQFEHAQMPPAFAPNPATGPCSAKVVNGPAAVMSCGAQASQGYGFAVKDTLGGVASPEGQAFVIASYLPGANALLEGMSFRSFELPLQLGAPGSLLAPPPIPTPHAQGFPVYSSGGFSVSPDGSLGLVSFSVFPDNNNVPQSMWDYCKNELAVYDLYTGNLLTWTEYQGGGTPYGKVENGIATIVIPTPAAKRPCASTVPTDIPIVVPTQ